MRNASSVQARLLPDSTLVESKLLALQNVTIDTTALTRTTGNNSVQTAGLELPLQRRLDLATSRVALSLLLLNTLALLHLLFSLTRLLLPPATNTLAVVRLIPLTESRSIDLDNGGLGEGVGADKLVVGRVESHSDNANLAGNTLRTPREVSGFEAQATELAVAAARAHEMDALGADTGVGGLAALLESSVVQIALSANLRSD